VPPIRVDHAFYSRALRCLNIREGEGAGSDHKPLIAEFVWAE
jgi:endonuclease/exonuclease/phosphatase (EEP) superfamily protein YafD